MDKNAPGKKKLSRKKKILFSLIAVVVSVFTFLIISEIVLRAVPIPGIDYNTVKFDTLTGAGYYPNSTNIYRNDRGDFVKRKLNKWGYYDKNYRKEKKEGYVRIGFFGDSFTQAIQVPLEEVFHYIIEDSLQDYKVETMSFGVSGFSMFQSYLTCEKWADFFDLDLIVYVFYENDLGDQIETVKKSPNIPYPVLDKDQIIVDNSFKEQNKYRARTYYKVFDYLCSRFLVFATISERLHLLSRYGVQVNATDEDRLLKRIKHDTILPIYPPELNQNDNPCFWPDSLRNHATNLAEHVLLNWKNQVLWNNRDFVVLYTPREFNAPTAELDAWKPWLEKVCFQNQIPFVDPTDNLLNMELTGKEVFYDHYTAFGHQVVASVFIDWYITN